MIQIQAVEYSLMTFKMDSEEWTHAIDQLTQQNDTNPGCRVLSCGINTDSVEWSHALEQLTQQNDTNPGCRVLSCGINTDSVE